jgi:hypothetical protein
MKKILDWFKEFWFVWFFILLFYVGSRISGYDIKIVKQGEVDKEVNLEVDWSKYKPAAQ